MTKLSDIPNYSKDLPFIESILSGIAKFFTWILIHTPITGTQVTLISIVFAIAGSLLAANRNFALGLIAFYIFILLDHVDGQVARFKGESGPHGVYLDSRAHYIVEPLFFIGLGIGAMHETYGYNSLLYLVAGIACAVLYLMRQTLKVEGLMDKNIRSLKSETNIFGKINYILFDFIRINNPLSLMAFAIFFNYIGQALCVYAVLFGLNMIYSFYNTYNSLKGEPSSEP